MKKKSEPKCVPRDAEGRQCTLGQFFGMANVLNLHTRSYSIICISDSYSGRQKYSFIHKTKYKKKSNSIIYNFDNGRRNIQFWVPFTTPSSGNLKWVKGIMYNGHLEEKPQVINLKVILKKGIPLCSGQLFNHTAPNWWSSGCPRTRSTFRTFSGYILIWINWHDERNS